MPQPRLFISALTTIVILTSLLYVSLIHDQSHFAESNYKHKAQATFVETFFSFHGPSALFTPTATISLTDDNSTAFAARPAAFGPLLPAHGLSGSLWIGCGFIDDQFGRGNIAGTVEGELGCSDIPGWEKESDEPPSDSQSDARGDGDDGEWTRVVKTDTDSDPVIPPERPEIEGRVVLLSRGGCGFLDKVLWAQRRGATAVIVGDNIVGGALVRMYARGDTSKAKIPSVFTSHGTAHLLSTLTPHGFGLGSSNSSSRTLPGSGSTATVNAADHFDLEDPISKDAPQFGGLESYVVPPPDLPAAVDQPKKHRQNPTGQPTTPPLHEGLWVTLTPSNMSPSPFFNTLFMLVVSPLVTLAVVYTMLLLRTRIQRQRWRAPKSVVERLPVRTYRRTTGSAQSSSTSIHERQTLNPTTPLLCGAVQPDNSSHPQSPSSIEEVIPSSSVPRYGTIDQPSSSPTDREKEPRPTAWRRRFGGAQVECVICLDEYVDGVSRVLELPCGHDFHAECITPWLITRRRTCPICKGDVVRSLREQRTTSAGSSQIQPSNNSRNTVPSDADDDAVQIEIAETENREPGADLPVDVDFDADPERASPTTDRAASRDGSRQGQGVYVAIDRLLARFTDTGRHD